MKKKLALFMVIVSTTLSDIVAQPYIDIINCSFQTFSSVYKSNNLNKNKTNNVFLNVFFPKELKNGNTILIRMNSELINSTFSSVTDSSSQLIGISVPLGYQFVSKNKKWKTIVMLIPKISSDFKDVINKKDILPGGMFLINYFKSDKLKIKAGLFYSHEAFGNFFIPLAGIDWKTTKRINMYGTLPNNYKIEYSIIRDKFYSGICFRSYTRSFRLSKANNNDYVRYDEMQIKIFFDYFIYKRVLLFGETGYSIGKNPLQYRYNSRKEKVNYNPIYTPLKPYLIFNLGLAYRIRFDLEDNLTPVK